MRHNNNQLDVSAHDSNQNSRYELKGQSPSPTTQNERECIEEVTDTGFCVADEAVTSRTQSAEVYFYMKSKFKTSKWLVTRTSIHPSLRIIRLVSFRSNCATFLPGGTAAYFESNCDRSLHHFVL